MTHLRYALRQLGRRPGFSIVVIAMLAIGIGSTTAMFSLFQQVLLQPLPVPEAEQLVNLGAPGPKWGTRACGVAGDCDAVFSYPMFRDLEARQTVLTGIAGHRVFPANLSYRGQTSAQAGVLISGNYFQVLGIKPALGRLILPADEPQVGESAVAVLSHDYWQNAFGGDPNVVGQTLLVNGQTLTIIGIAPGGFHGTILGIRPNVFVPLTLRWLMEPMRPRDDENRLAYWVYLFARLQPNVSLEQAAASLNTLYGGILNEVEAPLNSSMPAAAVEAFRRRQLTVEPGARGQSTVPGLAAQPLTLLFGVTTLVLLIVCVNIANLLLGRGAARAGEMAIRASIGASRVQLVKQLVIEAAVLALLGGIASLPIAAATLAAIGAFVPEQFGNGISATLNAAAILFVAGASLSTIVVFGLLPAFRATRPGSGHVVKGHASQAADGRGMARFRSTLTMVQIAFSTVLLVLAGLFTQSLMNIGRVDLGMDVDSLVTFTVSPRLNGYTPDKVTRLFDSIEEQLAAQPGVIGVTSSSVPLITDTDSSNSVAVEGIEMSSRADPNAMTNRVGPTFFRTLSIPLRAGREFAAVDTLTRGSPQVAIVNEAFVRKFNLEDHALGTRFAAGGPTTDYDIEIVGVVADAKYSTVKDSIPPQYFLPRRQDDNVGTMSFYLRAGTAADALLQMIPRVVAGIDPDLPISDLMTMQATVRNNIFLDRLITILSAAFAGLATALAAIGVYGVLAYNVTQRTRELGLRLALGATPRQLRMMVLKQVGLMALVGMAFGLAAAVVLGRAAEALLFGLGGYEPAVLAATVAVVSAVVLLAGYFPARRASRVAPMEAFRYD